MTNNPLVSIILPTYNRAGLIGESIQSVIHQTYTNWELIIVDDGSTDNTADIVSDFSDQRISYLIIDHSGRLGLVRNFGIKNSAGDFIAFLDSDDLWHPEKLYQQVNLFKSSNATAFIFTHVEIFGPSATIISEYKTIIAEDLLERYLEEHHFIFYPSALIFRKLVISEIGLLNEHQPIGADTEFFMRLCHRYKGSFIKERLVRIRKHDHNVSSNSVMSTYYESVHTIKNLYREKILSRRVYRKTIGKFYYKIGLLTFRNNELRDAMSFFAQYCRIKPFHWKGWVRLVQAFTKYLFSSSLTKF
jgi:glycosyltransferase involved in cell wall biosynthesis